MLSVASLLNPTKSEPRSSTRLPSSPSPSQCCTTTSSSYGNSSSSSLLPTTIQTSIKKQKMTKDGAVFAKGKIKGEVNFPPFENLDEDTKRQVQKFQVYPLGKIEDYCRHIPYNSEKKNFLEKTGRESFEVFQYIFKVPGDDKDYTVMWDYNIGLVRITPFFKCCKYSKTTPAKMLGLNPGLKEITHSITGGALAAQGYWMPYSCALAICTTFCSHISPALIPIFGPSFPSKCIVPDDPSHGRMIIDSSIIQAATIEAENYRLQYTTFPSKTSSSRDSNSPLQSVYSSASSMLNSSMLKQQADMSRMRDAHLDRRLGLKRPFAGDTPYSESIDDAGSETSSADAGYFHSPMTPTSASSLSGLHSHSHSHNHNLTPIIPNWGTHTRSHQHHNLLSHSANSSINLNMNSGIGTPKMLNANVHAPSGMGVSGYNPWLSAIPRSVADLPVPDMGLWRAKRRVQEVSDDADADADVDTPSPKDEEYDGEESASVTTGDEKSPVDGNGSKTLVGLGIALAPNTHTHTLTHTHTTTNTHPTPNPQTKKTHSEPSQTSAACAAGAASSAEEKKAAWLLMKLSVKDGESSSSSSCGITSSFASPSCGAFATVAAGTSDMRSGRWLEKERESECDFEGPRVKRRRATSL